MLKHPTLEDNPTPKRRKKPVVKEDRNQKKITTMFKPKVNPTSQVYSDVKTQYKIENNLSEDRDSTDSARSSSTDVKVAVPVQDCVDIRNIILSPAGRSCPDYGKPKSDFTSREQLSE